MPDDLIPADVRQFILRQIDSIAQLEALLLLSATPQWSVSSLARRLYITEPDTSGLLTHLQAENIVIALGGDPPVFEYRPATPELADMIKRVVDVYAKHLVPVTNLVHSKSKSRIREFADAFKLRKEE